MYRVLLWQMLEMIGWRTGDQLKLPVQSQLHKLSLHPYWTLWVWRKISQWKIAPYNLHPSFLGWKYAIWSKVFWVQSDSLGEKCNLMLLCVFINTFNAGKHICGLYHWNWQFGVWGFKVALLFQLSLLSIVRLNCIISDFLVIY